MSPTCVVVGHLKTTSKEARDKVLKQFEEIAEYSKGHEPGVLKYAITVPRDAADQTSIYAIEEYADQAVSDTHMAAIPVQSLIGMFSAEPAVLAEPPKVYQLEFSSAFTRPEVTQHPDPFIVFATCELKESNNSGLVQLWSSIVQMSKADEPATLMYGLFKNKDNGGLIGTVEAYEEEKAFEAHCKVDVVDKLVSSMKSVNAEVDIMYLKRVVGWLSR